MKFITPVEYIISVFGSQAKLARAIHYHPSTICKWQKPRAEGGSDGKLPRKALYLIISCARDRNITLDSSALVHGMELQEDDLKDKTNGSTNS